MSLESKVKSIVVDVVHKVRPESTAREAAAIMADKDIGCLVVSGSEGAMGMITERDILRKVTATGVDASKVRVRDIMSVPLVVVSTDTSIGDAAKKMIENGIKRLVVLGEDGTLLGLITMTDIVRWAAGRKELSDTLTNYLNYDVP